MTTQAQSKSENYNGSLQDITANDKNLGTKIRCVCRGEMNKRFKEQIKQAKKSQMIIGFVLLGITILLFVCYAIDYNVRENDNLVFFGLVAAFFTVKKFISISRFEETANKELSKVSMNIAVCNSCGSENTLIKGFFIHTCTCCKEAAVSMLFDGLTQEQQKEKMEEIKKLIAEGQLKLSCHHCNSDTEFEKSEFFYICENCGMEHILDMPFTESLSIYE